MLTLLAYVALDGHTIVTAVAGLGVGAAGVALSDRRRNRR